MNKILPILLIIGGVSGFANAQRTRLYPEGGRAEASKVFRPKTQKDSDLYDVYLRKYQEVSIKVISSSVFITRGNECGMYFRLFDDKGEETKIGDSPAGVDDCVRLRRTCRDISPQNKNGMSRGIYGQTICSEKAKVHLHVKDLSASGSEQVVFWGGEV